MSECTRPAPGWRCTRPADHTGPCAAWPVSASDPERTPVVLHSRPSPVVVRSGDAPKGPPPLPSRATPRAPTPIGGTLAPLGGMPVPGPEHFTTDEPPTERGSRQAVLNRHLRTCLMLPVEDLRLVAAFALRLRRGVGE